jgi:enoyl-CoA hydratase
MAELEISRQGRVAVLTFNRPEAMNALSRAVRRALAEAMIALDRDPDVGAVVLTGAGDRAFTAGLDLKELGRDPDGLEAATADDPTINPVKAIEACGKPVVGAINGVAITGGFEVALACDVLVASTRARFADTHARVGIMPGWGLSQKLSRLVGPYRAKELSLTGNFLDAQTAAAWGLVNRVVEPAALMPTALGIAADIAGSPPDMIGALKRLIDDGYGLPFADALRLETERSSAHNGGIRPDEIQARRGAVQARGRAQ